MPKIFDFTLSYNTNLSLFLESKFSQMIDFRILAKSLDARKANIGKIPTFQYKVEVLFKGENWPQSSVSFPNLGRENGSRPLIVGAGPAGLFCALRLLEYGIPSIVIERGDRAQNRMKKIASFWRYGKFDSNSNVCFGEGGAGLFSDGKLLTRIKNPNVNFVLDKLVMFGAKEEIKYLSNPHLGSNKIRELINNITGHLESNGTSVLFNHKVEGLLFENVKTNNGKTKIKGLKLKDIKSEKVIEMYSDKVVLAMGHSARELYSNLKECGVALRPKDFAIGVRVEHPRIEINRIQHGNFLKEKELGAAKYRLSYQDKMEERGVYSFCMCPGGYVLSSGTEGEGLVVNGMSNSGHNSPWSNSAIVVTVKAGRDFPDSYPLSGLDFITQIEKKAFELSKMGGTGKELPAMTVGEFLNGNLNDEPLPPSSSPSKVIKVDLNLIFPKFVMKSLKNGLLSFEKNMKGILNPKALLIAPETRTSSPVTILRDRQTFESISHIGLYPSGEGAGYAGGITSAAADGVSVADAVAKAF